MPGDTSSQSKRGELLEIAGRLFYRQGFGATGVKQIIEEAGIAKGTFYTHFKSKEELGVAWLQARHRQWMGWLEEALGEAETPRGKLLAIFDFLGKWLKESEFRGCAFLNTMAETPDPSSEMRAEVASHKEGLRQRTIDLVRQHFAGAPEDFVQQKGTIIFLLLEASIVESQNFQRLWPVEAARAEVDALLRLSVPS